MVLCQAIVFRPYVLRLSFSGPPLPIKHPVVLQCRFSILWPLMVWIEFVVSTVGSFVFVFPKLVLSLDTCSKMVMPGIRRYISSL